MPVTVPLWVVAASGIFSILVVKQMFGGIGCNFANPALMGRLFTMVVWPGAVMQYVAPPDTLAAAGFDAVSSATVLGTVKMAARQATAISDVPWRNPRSPWRNKQAAASCGIRLYVFFYGNRKCRSCSYLYCDCSDPDLYIRTGRIIYRRYSPEPFGGGLILGACYRLTDYAFATRRGRLLYAVTAGIITAAIRIFSFYPEESAGI